MNLNNLTKNTKDFILNQFGIEITSEYRREKSGFSFYFRPTSLLIDEGFKIRLQISWKRIYLDFIPENKSGLLLIAMGNTIQENKVLFSIICSEIINKHGSISMQINGNMVEPQQPEKWPMDWINLNVQLKSPIVDSDGDLEMNPDLESIIQEWLALYVSLIYPLLPLIPENRGQAVNIEGLPEGARKTVVVNKYERSQVNRQTCISFLGTKCHICGFDFEKKYGPIGKGYIEVHHIVPVSVLGDNYQINPLTDLIPICSNCHSIIHKKTPPYSIDEIKLLVGE